MKWVLYYPHFPDEEIEVPGEYVTCPKSQLVSDGAEIQTVAAWVQSDIRDEIEPVNHIYNERK